ncbi:MAG: response regulator transcription factor [Geitlerinemataceae cyanobacterium]
MLAIDVSTPQTPADFGQPKRVLVVEDEELIREMVALALQDEGYSVSCVDNGRDALACLTGRRAEGDDRAFDLIVLDIMLPHINGLDLCRVLRQQGNPIPILVLSAKASETDRVLGLEVGADDYLCKPFGMRELIARCRALLRRARTDREQNTPEVFAFEGIELYPQQCRVVVRGEEVNLAPKEFRLLELFVQSPRRVWSREQLLDRIWGFDFVGDSKTVDVHIRWLREKIEIDPSRPQYIVTIRGFGYRLG